jgi:hypothetical protein|tara:strand:+ start:128 stop:415 length:288 start_codon:yes stop_codon:yes gene_type:complete
MHYRITKVHHDLGKRDDIIAYLETKDEDIRSIEGLQSVRMIEISETESIAISKYENEQQLTMAEEKFKEIMGGMMPFMTAPPEVNNGDECWSIEK